MALVERNILISATPEIIDSYVLNPAMMPEWFVGAESVEADGHYPAVGGRINVVYRTMGIAFNLTLTSESFAQGQHLHLHMDGMITGTQNWHYEPAGGGTRLHCSFDYDVPGGGLGKALDKLLLERINAENVEKSLENLKSLIERG